MAGGVLDRGMKESKSSLEDASPPRLRPKFGLRLPPRYRLVLLSRLFPYTTYLHRRGPSWRTLTRMNTIRPDLVEFVSTLFLRRRSPLGSCPPVLLSLLIPPRRMRHTGEPGAARLSFRLFSLQSLQLRVVDLFISPASWEGESSYSLKIAEGLKGSTTLAFRRRQLFTLPRSSRKLPTLENTLRLSPSPASSRPHSTV